MSLPGFSYELQNVAAVGASLFIPVFLTGVRSPRVRTAYLVALISVTAWIIFV